MTDGFSLPAMLLGLALAASVLMLAFDYDQRLRLALHRVSQRLTAEQQLQQLIQELRRDLGRTGNAGCQPLPATNILSGKDLVIQYADMRWQIIALHQDASGAMAALQIQSPGAEPLVGSLLLGSCNRLDRLEEGQDFSVSGQPPLQELHFHPGMHPPVGGKTGHHLPSLQAGPLITRRYRWHAGWLSRQSGEGTMLPLLPLDGFTVEQPDQTSIALGFQLPGQREWQRVRIGLRQQGMALAMVLVLVFCASLLLSALQRQVLDAGRLTQLYADNQRTFYLADHALAKAESAVELLAAQPDHASWFTPDCQSWLAPAPWSRGLCSRATPGDGLQPAWLRANGSLDFLSACVAARHCVALPLPGWFSGRAGRQPWSPNCQTVNAGQVEPCYIVEWLDADFRGQALFRITVAAWGREGSSTRLQSLYAAGGMGRLAWLQLPPPASPRLPPGQADKV